MRRVDGHHSPAQVELATADSTLIRIGRKDITEGD
jgi:hypothetical protein